jgi:hypothetical protein
MVSYEDTNGVTQHNSSLNVVLSVKFKHHIRKALVSDLEREFGHGICLPPMFSTLVGLSRFSLCDNAAHPDHSASGSAHRYPADYRERVQQYFR